MPKFSLASTPKYRRHKATGQAIVTIAGRDRYLGPYGSKASRIEYDRLVSAWIAEGRPTTITATCDLTIVELCARYLQHAEQHYASGKGGEIPAMRAIIKRLRKWYGPTLAIEFGPRSLKALRQRMIDEGLSRNTINQNCFRVRRIFRWAVSDELLPESVCRALECVDSLRRNKSAARETDPVLPVAEVTIEATLPHLPPIVADMVRLQRLTGARPGEIVIMRPCDVDTTGEVWAFRPHSHKTQNRGLERVIFIGPRGQDVLRPYLLRDKASYCFCPAQGERQRRAAAHKRRVTPLTNGNRPGTNRVRVPKRTAGLQYDTDAYRKAITRACEIVFGMPEQLRRPKRGETADERTQRLAAAKQWRKTNCWHPHQLRHSAATEIRKKFDIEAAQVTLGHTSPMMTAKYTQRDLAKAEEVMAKVG